MAQQQKLKGPTRGKTILHTRAYGAWYPWHHSLHVSDSGSRMSSTITDDAVLFNLQTDGTRVGCRCEEFLYSTIQTATCTRCKTTKLMQERIGADFIFWNSTLFQLRFPIIAYTSIHQRFEKAQFHSISGVFTDAASCGADPDLTRVMGVHCTYVMYAQE